MNLDEIRTAQRLANKSRSLVRDILDAREGTEATPASAYLMSAAEILGTVWQILDAARCAARNEALK